MTAIIIDGKTQAAFLREKIKQRVEVFSNTHHHIPGLAVVLVGEDPASHVYVKNKIKMTREVGMHSFEYLFDTNVTIEILLECIKRLNEDPKVNGILVQLPLPSTIDSRVILDAVSPKKDVDGFHVINRGLLASGQEALIPCTPLGCLYLLRAHIPDLSGMRALVIGRSLIVGQPMAQLLVQQNMTVTIAHSRTKDIEEECRRAEIIVAAVGKPSFVKAEWVSPQAVIIDVGIHRIQKENGENRLIGDVDFENVSKKVKAITPVPGGVGPMTIACLLENTLKAAMMHYG